MKPKDMEDSELFHELTRLQGWQDLRTTPPYDEPWKLARQINNLSHAVQVLAEIEIRKIR